MMAYMSEIPSRDPFSAAVDKARQGLSYTRGRNISVRTLARQAGIPESTLAYNLSAKRAAEGRRVDADIVRKLAAVLPIPEADLMRAAGGTLVSKVGAEGVFCAALLPSEGHPALGFALKVLDGDNSLRARNPSVTEGLRQTGMLTEQALNKLEMYWVEEIRNRPGDLVGMVRPAFTLSVAES